MARAPFEDWIAAVKNICEDHNIDYDDVAAKYSFQQAYDNDLTPGEALEDYYDLRVFVL